MKVFRYILLTALMAGLVSCRGDVIVPDPGETDPVSRDDPKEEPVEDPDDDEKEEKTPRIREGEIPTVHISVNKSDLERLQWDKTYWINGTVLFSDPDHWYSDQVTLDGKMQMRGRGQTSFWQPKKPYRIKLEGHEKVFGMAANRDWDLIANYNDKSLLRNTLGYKVSKVCGLPWTPRVRACDVYVNGSYEGSYLVVQHKEVAGKKVNINPEAGDYYLEVETNECDFRTYRLRVPIHYKDPTYAEMTPTRREEIRKFIDDWDKAVSEDSFGQIWSLMDMASFVNYYIVEEVAKNIDGNFRKSTFMTKERGKKLILYHIWDFDIAFGNCDYMHTEFLPDSRGIYGNDPEGFFVKVVDEQAKGSGLFQHLFKDPTFVSAVKNRWQEVYPELKELGTWVRNEAAVNRASYDRNFERWDVLGTYLWPNPSPIPEDYDGELDALVDFYDRRIAWMNDAISAW